MAAKSGAAASPATGAGKTAYPPASAASDTPAEARLTTGAVAATRASAPPPPAPVPATAASAFSGAVSVGLAIAALLALLSLRAPGGAWRLRMAPAGYGRLGFASLIERPG